MFRTAGFGDVDRVDITSEYRETAAAWLAQRELRAEDLRGLFGVDVHEEKVRDGYETIEAIDQGLLRRYLYVAEKRG